MITTDDAAIPAQVTADNWDELSAEFGWLTNLVVPPELDDDDIVVAVMGNIKVLRDNFGQDSILVGQAFNDQTGRPDPNLHPRWVGVYKRKSDFGGTYG